MRKHSATLTFSYVNVLKAVFVSFVHIYLCVCHVLCGQHDIKPGHVAGPGHVLAAGHGHVERPHVAHGGGGGHAGLHPAARLVLRGQADQQRGAAAEIQGQDVTPLSPATHIHIIVTMENIHSIDFCTIVVKFNFECFSDFSLILLHATTTNQPGVDQQSFRPCQCWQ